MTIHCEKHGDVSTLRIENELTIYSAADTKQVLARHLLESQALEIDLSRVGEIDTAGCQLLLVLEQEAATQGKTLHFTGHSRAVLDLLDTYNLAAFFGDPLVLPVHA